MPVTVTDGVACFATIRSATGQRGRRMPGARNPLRCRLRDSGVRRRPARASARAKAIPVGAERRNSRDPFSRFQSASDSPAGSSRSVQPPAARRTSSWWTKYSTVLTVSSNPPIANGDSRGGPPLNSSISSG